MANINEELYKAITYGTTEQVKNILVEGADPNYNIRGTPPLFLALYHNKMDVFNMLLEHPDIDINIQNSAGNTILVECLSQNLKDVIDILFDRNLSIFKPNEKGEYAIHLAILYRNIDIVNKILENNVNLINIRDKSGNTPLILASRSGDKNLIETILKYNPNINLEDKFNKNAAHYLNLKGLGELIDSTNDDIIIKREVIEIKKEEEQLQAITKENNVLSNIKRRRN